MRKEIYQQIKLKGIKSICCLIVFTFVVLNQSCKKYLELAPPKNQIVSSQVFINDQTAISAVSGLYSQMVASPLYFMNGGLTAYCGLSSDELFNTATSTTLDPFTKNSVISNSSIVQNNLWRNAYIFIYQANACIEGLTQSSKLSVAVKNQLLGEAKFIRAMNFFYLANVFGDVPLVVSTNYEVNEVMPRTPVFKVYEQIVSDLKEAETLLVPDYPSSGRVRVNRWAAAALLARVYLYQKQWPDAEAQSTIVINSGAYHLLDDLKSVFLAGSDEAILQFFPTPSGNTAEGNAFNPSSKTVRPTYALTPGLIAAFEPNDLRATSWLNSSSVGGTVYTYPYKYKIKANPVVTEYYTVLRFAEQYLIRAEARAMQDKITGDDGALKDLNRIRLRAGLVENQNSNPSAVLTAIEQERRIELFAEWGHRWFDLKRTGRIDAVLGNEKPQWQSSAAYFPIPYQEIQKNPFLTQNEGYQ